MKDGEIKTQREKSVQGMKVVNDATSFQIHIGQILKLLFSLFI